MSSAGRLQCSNLKGIDPEKLYLTTVNVHCTVKNLPPPPPDCWLFAPKHRSLERPVTQHFSISLEGLPPSNRYYEEREAVELSSSEDKDQEEGQHKPFTLSLLFIFGQEIYQDPVGLDF